MSKYSTLWEYVQSNGSQSVTLTFEKIQSFAFLCLPLSVSVFLSSEKCAIRAKSSFQQIVYGFSFIW